jgi:hypothetical protein
VKLLYTVEAMRHREKYRRALSRGEHRRALSRRGYGLKLTEW